MKYKIAADLQKCFFDYLLSMATERGLKHNTILSYRIDIESFFNFCNQNHEILRIKDLENFILQDFRDWLVFRYNKKLLFTSTNRAISALQSFFLYCNKNKIITNNVIMSLKRPKTVKSLPKAVETDKIFAMLDQMGDKNDWKVARDRSLLTLIYGTGLRISEALSIKRKDWGNRNFIIVKGKRNKERMVPILEAVAKEVNKYLELCPFSKSIMPEEYLFISNKGNKYNPRLFQKKIENIRKSLNLEDTVTPHAFRHSCATDLLADNGNIRHIQKLLGHSSLSTTQIYTKVSNQELINAYKKYKG